MEGNHFGWLGKFSAAGVVILGALYLLDMVEPELWRVSTSWTLTVALVAGLGALAL